MPAEGTFTSIPRTIIIARKRVSSIYTERGEKESRFKWFVKDNYGAGKKEKI